MLLGIPAGLLVLFILTPISALIVRAATSPRFISSLRGPVVRSAVLLTAETTLGTLLLALACGTPLAYFLSRRNFPGKRLVDVIVDFPLMLPPVVAGVALLMAFGRRGLLGPSLQAVGVTIPFSTPAVILAQLFVAGPFYVRGARVGFSAVPQEVEEAAAIDGASAWSTFIHVTVPLALPGISGGIVLCFGRALAEFGATLLFAGNLIGRTQTMPLAINQALETDLSVALALSVLLIAASSAILTLARLLLGSRFSA